MSSPFFYFTVVGTFLLLIVVSSRRFGASHVVAASLPGLASSAIEVLLIIREIRTTERLDLFSMPLCNNMSEACKEEDGAVKVVALTSFTKTLIFVLVIVPKILICSTLMWLGCQWLTATNSFSDLVMNSIAMEFVTGIDEALYETLLPVAHRQQVAEINFVRYKPKDSGSHRDKEFAAFKRSFIYLCVALTFVFVYKVAGPGRSDGRAFGVPNPMDVIHPDNPALLVVLAHAANEEKLQKAPTKLEQALAEIVASHAKMQSGGHDDGTREPWMEDVSTTLQQMQEKQDDTTQGSGFNRLGAHALQLLASGPLQPLHLPLQGQTLLQSLLLSFLHLRFHLSIANQVEKVAEDATTLLQCSEVAGQRLLKLEVKLDRDTVVVGMRLGVVCGEGDAGDDSDESYEDLVRKRGFKDLKEVSKVQLQVLYDQVNELAEWTCSENSESDSSDESDWGSKFSCAAHEYT
ncbi:Hypothetical protein (Fragment) [Durusdinium trenchii]|uniref:Uncharacterized protein n=1 Tax=Durusdinium trenchii TaxID=1381693 RepID=A0ABP0MT65_9DINO